MKCFVLAAFVLLAGAPALPAATMGISDGHDLDALWARAQQSYDLSEHDGIVLLESQRVTITPGGDRITRVHRVVWIGSARGIRQYADLRVPYNSAHSELEVIALRTWRDDRWWPDEEAISETAVVETLPQAVALADDYTTMRETMLLHDGVELPCILETVYDITDRGGANEGTSGLWVFPQLDAAVRVRLAVQNDGVDELTYTSGNGAPEPAAGGNTTTWTMDDVDRIGVPPANDPAAFAPFVAWSTWPDWRTLGRRIAGAFDGAAVTGEELARAVGERLKNERSAASKARAVARFVDETVRPVQYDCRHWNASPRPATRTWETAYGHNLDRAVLAAALFRVAGLEAEPVFRSVGYDDVAPGVADLSRFDHVAVHVAGPRGLHGYYDPDTGRLSDAAETLFDRVVWRPALGDPPAGPGDTPSESRYELAVTLGPGENDGWSGTGYLFAGGLFSPYGRMAGLGDEARTYVAGVARAAIAGATVEGFNPETFTPDGVAVGFTVTVGRAETDAIGREAVVLGLPGDGVNARLPAGLQLYHERRDTPVRLPGPMIQRLLLRLDTGGRNVVHLPGGTEVDNPVGHFSVTTSKKEGWVTIESELWIESASIPPETWGELRALLLEAADPAHRTVLLE